MAAGGGVHDLAGLWPPGAVVIWDMVIIMGGGTGLAALVLWAAGWFRD